MAKMMNIAVMKRMHVVLFFFVGLCLQQHCIHKQQDVSNRKITQQATGSAASKIILCKFKKHLDQIIIFMTEL